MSPRRQFFVSHARSDRAWAEWIAWILEDAGYSVILRSWDFAPGQDFVLEMSAVVEEAARTIIVVSAAYLESQFTQAEWAAAFARDPLGRGRTIIPVRIEPVALSGLLASIVYIDLVGLDEASSREALLRGVAERAVSTALPAFPGADYTDRVVPFPAPAPTANHIEVPLEPLVFPGSIAVTDPTELLPFIKQFRDDYPSQRTTAFIMMQFRDTRPYHDIDRAIRMALSVHGIAAVRADDRAYSEELFPNIKTYMHGCGFGVAVFDRIEADLHNPNVALEVGYMLALGKRVCLLKDKSLRQLPTDMIGSLYSDFDVVDIDASVARALERWLRQRNLLS